MSDSDYLFKLKNANLYRNCIKCGYCSSKIDSSSNSVFCAINPSFYANFNQNSYNFAENVVKSDNNYEKFAVVGGGLSGVNCAIFLAKSGKRVDIFESGEILLKNNRLREIFGYNKPLFSYNNFLCNEIETLKNKGLLSVFLGEKFSLKTCDYSKYLGIIVATGSSEKFSTIPGAVLKNVKNIFEVLDNKKLVLSKKNITIDAKSELSLSLAQYLLLNGKNVTIIITSVDFLFEMKNSKLTYYLYSLKKLNCNVFVMAKINKIESDFIEISINSRLTREDFAVTILNLKSKKKYKFDKRVKNIDSDILIYEPEVYSNNRLYYELVSSKYDGKLFMIGNALYPSDFSESIKTAFFVAKNI